MLCHKLNVSDWKLDGWSQTCGSRGCWGSSFQRNHFCWLSRNFGTIRINMHEMHETEKTNCELNGLPRLGGLRLKRYWKYCPHCLPDRGPDWHERSTCSFEKQEETTDAFSGRTWLNWASSTDTHLIKILISWSN